MHPKAQERHGRLEARREELLRWFAEEQTLREQVNHLERWEQIRKGLAASDAVLERIAAGEVKDIRATDMLQLYAARAVHGKGRETTRLSALKRIEELSGLTESASLKTLREKAKEQKQDICGLKARIRDLEEELGRYRTEDAELDGDVGDLFEEDPSSDEPDPDFR